jgi:hypothetical protein
MTKNKKVVDESENESKFDEVSEEKETIKSKLIF